MANKNESTQGGIGFLGLLTLMFIGLKLTNYITWSWWWVLSPMWIPAAILLGIGVILLAIWLLIHTIQYFAERKRLADLKKKKDLYK